jgi:ABC-type dipeptide/oligopeptide/nickel transport system permease subunit
MNRFPFFWLLIATFLVSVFSVVAQDSPFKSQEVSEIDGVPVLVKHLPDWEKIRDQAKVTNSVAELKTHLGALPVLDVMDLSGGAEAVTANYAEGKLLVVEFPTPQASSAADIAITQKLFESASNSPVVYRRIGNYNAFGFEAYDQDAAAGLLDQIKYQKSVQWLGEDPFLVQKLQRYVVGTSVDVMISTVVFIVLGLCGSVLAGIITGYLFFRYRDQKRAGRKAFSDAGGLTRLNLDELSEPLPFD